MSTLLYNPDKKEKQQFINEFAVRTDLFNILFQDIQEGVMKYPEQHYLLLGQRGAGKTTLINRLKYAIEDDPHLNKWLIPVVFSEEQYNIIELVNLWESVALYLEDIYGFKGITKDIEKNLGKKNLEQLSLDVVLKHLKKENRKIILFIDNIGSLFKKFDELEIRRLREVLQTVPEIRLIAGSPVALEHLLDYHQPMYEFFKVIQLKGLTSGETIILLRKLAEINKETKRIENIINREPSRIETLRMLSGGIPRTIALLFQVFVDDEHGNALSDLEKILDMVTPLYKHRMDDLPKHQQKIVDAVAKNWDAISVRELTENLRMESKVISAQLRQLEKNQVIEKRVTNTKNHNYLLKERFFNIWYLMRYGRKQDKQRVIWLVKFLELWCDGKEIEKRINNYVEKVKNGQLDVNTHELYGEVYSYFKKIKPETKLLLKESTPKYVADTIELTEADFEKLIAKYFKSKDWNRIIDVALSIKEISTKQKIKLFKHVDSIKSKELSDIVQSSMLKDKGMTKENKFVPHFYLLFMLNQASGDLFILADNEGAKKSTELMKLLYKKLSNDYYIDEFDRSCFGLHIASLLAFKYYNLANDFILESRNIREDEEFKLFESITKYFLNGKDEKVFDGFGSEWKESCLHVSKQIEQNQLAIEKISKIQKA